MLALSVRIIGNSDMLQSGDIRGGRIIQLKLIQLGTFFPEKWGYIFLEADLCGFNRNDQINQMLSLLFFSCYIESFGIQRLFG